MLFFGEIIPSAIFTGPQKLSIAAKMAPLVKFCLFILTPLAWPIAKLLDKVLGHEHDGERYDRKELSVLVRLMYEERIAEKKKEKLQKQDKIQFEKNAKKRTVKAIQRSFSKMESDDDDESRRSALRKDEVTIVEGALQMSVTKVGDIFVPWKKVKLEKKSEVLTDRTLKRLHLHGYSRVPIYDDTILDHADDPTKAICGIVLTRDLILVNLREKENESITISDMKFYQPECLHPNVNLVDALNRLQGAANGRKRNGHLAIVCHYPEKAKAALEKNQPIPNEANVIGVVSLEDIIEEIIQEEIYDETDRLSPPSSPQMSSRLLTDRKRVYHTLV